MGALGGSDAARAKPTAWRVGDTVVSVRLLVVDAGGAEPREAVPRGDRWEHVFARGVEEAIERLASEPVDCILVHLPDSAGADVCRSIKASEATRGTPLVILTPSDDDDSTVRCLEAGADDCVSRAVDARVLEARLLAQVRRKRLDDASRRVRDDVVRREAEARAAEELAETRASLVEEIERKEKDLDEFSYSVSHDLRAPLRSIDGFSQALLEDFAEQLDVSGGDHLRRVRAAARRMEELIEGLLVLSRVGRTVMNRERIDLSGLASAVVAELRASNAAREVEVSIEDGIVVDGDARLLRVVLVHLLGNAWKFTTRRDHAKIELGSTRDVAWTSYFVKDNGAGFDMQYADKLFAPFQRLHAVHDFPGIGMGLATVRRIVERHGGRVVAEGAVGQGVRVSWSLSKGGI
jgi:two-component system NtrC family sensor kinase